MTHPWLFVMGVVLSLLAGCNDSGNGTSSGVSTPPTGAGADASSAVGPAGTGTVVGSFAGLAARAADTEPGATDEVVDLAAGVAALFGAPDGEPIVLGEPETLAELIRRLGG